MKRAAIYMRVSSDKQAKEGDSIPAQRAALHKYIDDRPDMICAGEYLDDGVSGTKEDRDELNNLLADVKAGMIDLILVTKLDRLYRNIRHYLNLQATLDKCGVGWLAIWEPIYDTTTPQGRLIVNQMMSIAQFEAENTGQRIRQVQAYKVTQGEAISGNTPAGYSIVNKHLVPDENAKYVQEAFELYARTGRLRDTVRAFTDVPRLPKYASNFKSMLQNRIYIGEYRGNTNYCDPIVTKDIFDAVQLQLSRNVKANQKRTYLFCGLLVCEECGHPLSSCFNHNAKIYRCRKHYQDPLRQCSNSSTISEHSIEKQLMASIRPQVEKLKLDYEIEQSKSVDMKRKRKSIETKMSRLKDLYVDGLISIEEYKTDREKYENELSDLTDVQPIQKSMEELEKMLDIGIEEMYWTFSEEEKRLFWRSIIKEIRFSYGRKIEIIFL